MKLIASLSYSGPDSSGARVHSVSRRKAFRSRTAAMRQCEKWARKSLRRFANASQRIETQNWGVRSGAFPFAYVQTTVTWAPHF